MAKPTVAQTSLGRIPDTPVRTSAFRRRLRTILVDHVEAILSEVEDLYREDCAIPPPPVVEALPLLLETKAAARFLGVSTSRFYELKRDPTFPRPVGLHGAATGETGKRLYQRAALEAWATGLQSSPRGDDRV